MSRRSQVDFNGNLENMSKEEPPIEKIKLDLSKVYAVIRYYNFFITGHLHAL